MCSLLKLQRICIKEEIDYTRLTTLVKLGDYPAFRKALIEHVEEKHINTLYSQLNDSCNESLTDTVKQMLGEYSDEAGYY